jgi:two-component system, sporulation sensor kinase E
MVNINEFLKSNLDLAQILLSPKLLDIVPGGFSIATDVSCQNIIHNPVTAKFLRIEPWGQFSHSAAVAPSVMLFSHGKELLIEEMPIQRATWKGEDVVGQEIEFIWDDGTSKIARWNATPLRDDSGSIRGCFATMEEITDLVHITRELKKYQTQLKELVEERTTQLKASEERFAKVFFSSPHAMSINRKFDFCYLEVNNQWLKNSKLNRDEVIGKKPLELGIPEEDYQYFIKLLNENGSVMNMESSLIKEKSIAGTILLSAEPIVLNGEECILFASNDITESKRIQTEMSRLDRLNLIGQMAAGIGHEIRNPMTVIRGYLQLMGSKPKYEADHFMIESMIDELDRANSIITEFLTLARNKPTELRNENINNLLHKLYPLIEADAYTQNKRVVLHLQELPNILLDTKDISQLVLNLCRNGLEAMDSGGALTIWTYYKDEQVILVIEDEGSGISGDNLDKLGTPFFTTKDYGTGLGLATSYSIAERHNSKISIETGSSGTKFLVSFPISKNT